MPNVNARKGPEREGAATDAPDQRPSPPRAQHVGVIDAIGAERPRVDQRHDLAPGVRRADAIAQAHEALGKRLDPE
jgi:hypothetical protein